MATSNNYLEDALGPKLVNAKGDTVATSSLAGKVVGLYFSASWCGPCRGFTPLLLKAYEAVRGAGKPLEVVLIGADRTPEDFRDYLSKMPWLALPFEEGERKSALNLKHKVRGIPALVILDEAGSVITKDGREAVMEDPLGAAFPWKPKLFLEVIGDTFTVKGGVTAGREVIEGKTLALYFSAHWCPPCRAFTPKLISLYKAMMARAESNGSPAAVEFVYVSSDKSEQQFAEYFGSMPWVAVPFEDSVRRKALGSMFGVRGIPALVTVGQDGVTINHTARGAASEDAEGLEFPWKPKPVADLAFSTQSNGFELHDKASLVVLMEGADDLEQKEVEALLFPIATTAAAQQRGSGEVDYGFFTTKSESGISKQIRTLCGMEDISSAPQMIIVDIPNNGSFYVPEGGAETEVTAETIAGFLAAHKANRLTRRNLIRG